MARRKKPASTRTPIAFEDVMPPGLVVDLPPAGGGSWSATYQNPRHPGIVVTTHCDVPEGFAVPRHEDRQLLLALVQGVTEAGSSTLAFQARELLSLARRHGWPREYGHQELLLALDRLCLTAYSWHELDLEALKTDPRRELLASFKCVPTLVIYRDGNNESHPDNWIELKVCDFVVTLFEHGSLLTTASERRS